MENSETEVETKVETEVETKVETKVETEVETEVETPSYSEQLNQLKSDFEEKLENQKKAYEQEIKERDNVIRQLMTSEADNSMQSSRLNEINKRRNYSKW